MSGFLEGIFAASGTSAGAGATTAAVGGAAATTASVGGVAATTAGVTAAGASGITATGLISGGLKVLSTLTPISSMRNQAMLLKFQSKQDEINSKNEEVRGLAESNEIRARLLRTLAQQNAASGTSGVSGGSVENARTQAKAQANRELTVSRSDSGIRKDNLLLSSESGRSTASRINRAATIKLIADTGKEFVK